MTFGSLFAGCGGFDLGFERAGMECRWQVEIDDYATRVLEKHWPSVQRYRDVREFPGSGPGELSVDCICGGDPCQENSRARSPHADTRSPSLGDQFIRVVDALRPRIVVRENPSRIRGDAPWPWWRFRSALESSGYVVLPFRLRACCFGLEHERDRLFVLAERADALQSRLEGWDQPRNHDSSLSPKQSREARRPVPAMVCPPTQSDAWSGLLRDRHVFSGGMDKHRIRGCGNSVPPVMAEWIGRRLMEVVNQPA